MLTRPCITLVCVGLFWAPSAAQSAYVLEFRDGGLVDARSVDNIVGPVEPVDRDIVDSARAASREWSSSRELRPRFPSPRGATAAAEWSSSNEWPPRFGSCAEAEAAGYGSMRFGKAGYRPGLDADNDGIACEPFRR